MRRRDGLTVQCTGPVALRRRFYRTLAEGLVAAAPGGLVLFEATVDSPVPRVTVRPGSLLGPPLATSTFAAASWVPGPVEAADRPGEPTAGRHAMLVPTGAPASIVPADPTFAAPDPAPLLGPAGWLGYQTFWSAGTNGRVWAARRFWLAGPGEDEVSARFPAVAMSVAREWSGAAGRPTVARTCPFGASRDWQRAAARSIPRSAWISVSVAEADRTAEPATFALPNREVGRRGHGVVLGSSGAGKTWFLAERAARAIARRESVIAIDLHGDLAPAILERLPPGVRNDIVAIDAIDRPAPGIAALAGSDDRAAAHLVAALRRLTADGTDVYWGFRLERIFDAFVRLVQESGGSLLDLYALLSDADRRDVVRLASRRTELVRFLEELGPIVRRTPDFLWPAAARLSKIVLVPALAELLCPADGGIPIEELVERGRSILVRLPFAALGPEAASFAGTLVLTRAYFGLAARRTSRGVDRPVLAVLDEVQGLSPRLVAEMLTEGRKFGLRLLVATQYPDRLAPELRHAAAGVAGEVVTFRVPPPSVAVVGGWIGLGPPDAARLLPDLPPGHGLVRDSDSGAIRPISPDPPPVAATLGGWADAVALSRNEFRPESAGASCDGPDDPVTESVLVAVLAAEESGRPLAVGDVPAAVQRLPGPVPDGALAADRLPTLARRGYLDLSDGRARVTPAGERRLGLSAPTGATRETSEHRALLLRAFRVFARRGYLLEIVRQGRYDTALPDGLFRQIPDRARAGTAAELARALDAARAGWAWRYFGGLDVHLEAEVSGALRPARIRHGYLKARSRGAFALFLVSDAGRAEKVRRTLRADGVGPRQAAVWTLAVAPVR